MPNELQTYAYHHYRRRAPAPPPHHYHQLFAVCINPLQGRGVNWLGQHFVIQV